MDVAVTAANSTYIVEDQQRMSRARNYFAWQARMILPELGRRVLEIGCGIGNFTELLADREAVVAVDSEPGCIELLKSRCPNAHAFALDAGSESLLDLARFHPDSCVLLNVLEHIDDDAGTLRRIASILPSRGRIVLLAPAFPSLYGPIDRNLGHHRRYSRGTIRQLARAAGLDIRKLRYVNAIGFFGWWTNAHLLRRAAQSESQIQWFDRLVPIISRLESMAPPPFGQSLFAVFEKP
jgi:2-polyprenyl-3-methyl-5-hydroxy-6-metoxy-1,4-benzoquinol methylase